MHTAPYEYIKQIIHISRIKNTKIHTRPNQYTDYFLNSVLHFNSQTNIPSNETNSVNLVSQKIVFRLGSPIHQGMTGPWIRLVHPSLIFA